MTPSPCDVPGCDSLSPGPCYRKQLCMKHGTEANVRMAAEGLEFHAWEAKCAWVARWVAQVQKTSPRPSQAATEATRRQA